MLFSLSFPLFVIPEGNLRLLYSTEQQIRFRLQDSLAE